MARLFDDASTEYLYIDSVPVGSYPFAFVLRFRSDDNTANMTGLAYHGATDHYIRLQPRTGTLYANKYDTSGYPNAASSAGYTQDVWHHAAGLFVAANDTRVLLDGANKGTSATSSTPTVTKTKIGWEGQGTLYMSGDIAEVAIYDLSQWPGATASDKADNFELICKSLAAGYTPEFFPLGRIAYWDLRSNIKDRQGAYDLTASGTTLSAHPKIIRPIPALYGAIEAYEPPVSEGGIMTCNTGFWGSI